MRTQPAPKEMRGKSLAHSGVDVDQVMATSLVLLRF